MGLIAKVTERQPRRLMKSLPIVYAGLFLLFCVVQMIQGKSFLSLFITNDQLGQLYYNSEKYEKAANAFLDPYWKGMAHYLNEDFTVAVDYFSQINTDEALFNRANAWAHSMNYVYAINDYDELLKRNPKHSEALINRPIVQTIIDDIMRLSKSQKEESGDSSKMKGEEDPMMAEGAERQTFDKKEIEQYTAEELLNDPSIAELWMKQVQTNPSQFLRSKFHMQLQEETEPTKIPNEGMSP